jgi:hypothetical protein
MRVQGWESILAEHIRQAYHATFAWGINDCCLWPADWVHKGTGTDFGSDWRGKYKTEAGAAKLMKKRGYTGPADIASEHLLEIPVPLAGRGDLLLHPEGCLGIGHGRHGFFLKADGVLMSDALACVRAWKV